MPDSGSNKTTGRNLPSWMSARENKDKSAGKKTADDSLDKDNSEVGTPEPTKQHGKAHSIQAHSKGKESKAKPSASDAGSMEFSKQLEGVVFALSGFVNPERGVLRSQAFEMGAEYQADWNPKCTLLVCAFRNTPKFLQVEADCGTIVSKEWITECYKQKKLVDMETYLMHAGKPWRRQSIPVRTNQDEQVFASFKPQERADRAAHPRQAKTEPDHSKPTTSADKAAHSKQVKTKPDHSKPTTSASNKQVSPRNHDKDLFSPSKVKKWAVDDLKRTVSWLDSQEEKPEPSAMKKIAAEGILTCLQDAIDSLKMEQNIGSLSDQWSIVPRVVEELIKLEKTESPASQSKNDLLHQALACKRVYEAELSSLHDDSKTNKKRQKTEESERNYNGGTKLKDIGAAAYDSDETVEMTEDEIAEAYDDVASSIQSVK